MDIIGVKVIVLFLLGLTKVGFGLLPLLLHKYLTKRNKLKCLDRFIGEFKFDKNIPARIYNKQDVPRYNMSVGRRLEFRL